MLIKKQLIMEFTEIETNSRKRSFNEQRHDPSSTKYRRTYDSLCLSIQSSCIFLDFNQSYDNVCFQCTETTDQYRPGMPYKLLHYPMRSSVEIIFSIIDLDFLQETHVGLNGCTGQHYHGLIDIFVNNIPVLTDFAGLSNDMAFREQSFTIPKHICVHGENKVKVQLSNNSPGIFWLSDARITGIYHVH
ncbi:Hypothetical predicted protein [Mytilus galloprovincialis]|uniref:Uncharacterized protein n=2 Tax=Mytilus galloprovincialis TaxID=29158 RepID=A0A8B6FEB2_MYTGA|nr:Hypothetical predicted protein [Mytilus galloprovincialis]